MSDSTPVSSLDAGAPLVDPQLARYMAEHAAPAVCADALIRDGQGRILLVDPVYKDGWDLPGGMLEDEEPDSALVRELGEELGLAVDVGRLLAVDAIPASVYGRTVLAFVYAGHLPDDQTPTALVPQDGEIRTAEFLPERKALELLPPPLRRRLAAALAAERGSHTAVLRDGHRPPPRRRDHYALLPAPMMAATVLVTDMAGRVLVLEPTYKDHLELPGGMVEAGESPAQAAARELAEELGLTVPVGRLLAVDTASAASGRHGRAVTCMVFAAPPLSPAQAERLSFPDGEIRAAYWLDRGAAARRLPARLAARVSAGLDALAAGGVIHLERGEPAAPSAEAAVEERAARARAAMVDRLTADGVLTDPGVRRALLAVRREVLLPRCYVRRPTAGGQPKAWQLLDGADPRDRDEWLAWIHDGDSVLVQHRGEPLDAPRRGQIVTGGGFTGMSTGMTAVVKGVQELGLTAGDRVLESGTGPGLVTAALCEIPGDASVTTIEVDPHQAAAARSRLAALGYRPRVVRGDGLDGCRGEHFDKILVSFAARCLPPALMAQLADGGTLLAPVTTGAVGWPAQAVVRRTGDALDAVLRPVPTGYRPGLGVDLVVAPDRMPGGPVTVRRGLPAPPEEAGFWLAVGHLLPGLVRVVGADRLTLYAPAEESCAVVRSDGDSWCVERTGPRDIWAEVESVHRRWLRAGRPDHYRLDLADPAVQRVYGGAGAHPLTWRLPRSALLPSADGELGTASAEPTAQ